MAEIKQPTSLTALLGAAMATGDLLAVWDVSAETFVKMTAAELAKAIHGSVLTSAPVETVITATGVTAYTIPNGATRIGVRLWGAGGGGGSGRRGAAASARSGGLGGWGSVPVEHVFPVSLLGSSVDVTIGTGGTGGAAITANDTNGNPGSAGGDTTFGSFLRALGGLGGLGGTNAATTFVTGAASVIQNGGQYSPVNTSVTAIATQAGIGGYVGSPYGGAAGGSGGSLSTGNAELLGNISVWAGTADPALAAPAAPATAGSAGQDGQNSSLGWVAGFGGGGGGPSAAGTAGAGGAGGRGSGGGGGGASVNGQSSGAGGAGGNGKACIVAYFD